MLWETDVSIEEKNSQEIPLKYAPSWTVGEMKIKPALWSHLTRVRMAKINKTIYKKATDDLGKEEAWLLLARIQPGAATNETNMDHPKNLKVNLLHDSAKFISGISCSMMLTSAIVIMVRKHKQPKCS